MSDYDIVLICQSNVVDYDSFSSWPIERLDLFKTMAYPRMVRYEGRFVDHLDLINKIQHGTSYFDADYPKRRELLNIWNLPSASGLFLANYLNGYGIKVKLINNIDSEWDLFEETYKDCESPPLIGISSTFYLSYKEIGVISKKLVKMDPNIEIVMGGAFANSVATTVGTETFEKHMDRLGIKYILHAFNSEQDLKDLILERKKGGEIKLPYNACTIDQDKNFIQSEKKWHDPTLETLDKKWELVDAPFLNQTIQIRTASGCPFSCAFCSYPVTAGGWKTMNDDVVRHHLDSVTSIPGINKIIFIDDTFNVPRGRFKDLLEIFKEYDFEWFSFLRVQYTDEDVVRSMKEAGCKGVYLGVESANDQILKNMNKKARKADFAKGLELLNKYGIRSLTAFVLGFPGETDETIRDNIDFIENYGVDFYSLKEFFLIENTAIDKARDKYNLVGMGSNWTHDTMSYKQAAEIKIDIFREVENGINIDPDTSLWYLAYLYDQGYDFTQIEKTQREINMLMKRQLNGDFSDDNPSLRALRDILSPELQFA